MRPSSGYTALHALQALRPDYTPGVFLGRGAYGQVYEVTEEKTGTVYAVKVFLCSTTVPHAHIPDEAIQEYRATMMLTPCPNLVTLRRLVILNNFTTCFFMKRYHCSLHTVLASARLTSGIIRCVFTQLARGIASMHADGVCHRDLKPANVFVDVDTGTVVIGDFGCVKQHLDPHASFGQLTGTVATCGYAPIETLLPTKQYGHSVDLWSLGVILYELVFGRLPFAYHDKRRPNVHSILMTKGTPSESARAYFGTVLPDLAYSVSECSLTTALTLARVPTEVQTLILGLLQYVPDERTPAAVVCAQPYVRDCPTDTGGLRDLPDMVKEALKRDAPQPVRRPIASISTAPLLLDMALEEGTSGRRCDCFDTWHVDSAETLSILTEVIDAYLVDAWGQLWLIDAWLVALATSCVLRLSAPPRERLVAIVTYGIAATATQFQTKMYYRFDWTCRLKTRVDVDCVTREEAGILSELGGVVPLLNYAVWKRAKEDLTSFDDVKTFFMQTLPELGSEK